MKPTINISKEATQYGDLKAGEYYYSLNGITLMRKVSMSYDSEVVKALEVETGILHDSDADNLYVQRVTDVVITGNRLVRTQSETN